MAAIIGIDLGTTNSVVAVWIDGEPRIIPNRQGHNLTPSVVAVDPAGKGVVVGHQALAMARQDPSLAVYSVMRFIGRRFDDERVQQELQFGRVPYKIEPARRGEGIEIALGEMYLTPQQVSAIILRTLKADADAYLGQEITQAVITVPAYFGDSWRQATRDAGRIAGLDVKRILNEPTAACLAFEYNRLHQERKRVVVYDLGGGTFDVSILDVGPRLFRVRTVNGDTHLGGDDLDWIIVDWVLSEIGNPEETQLRQDVSALARLRSAAEEAKIRLSTDESTQIQVPGPLSPSSDITDLAITLTRATLEVLATPWIRQTLHPCAQALNDARLTASDLDEVLLVGGQTRMPAVRAAVREFFGIEPTIRVNPEEAVALGAAVQAAVLAGEFTELRLASVTPLTLSVDIDGLMDTIVPRNTPTPVTMSKIYTTVQDDQDHIEIAVYQGERTATDDNIKLGSFVLAVPPARAGKTVVEVTFHVDQDGILHVTARDRNSGNLKEITITDSLRLSDEEIEAMVRDTEKHATEYTEQREMSEAQDQAENQGEQFAEQPEARVQDHPSDAPKAGYVASRVEELLSSLRHLLDQVTETRAEAENLETRLAQAQNDFDQELGQVNAEASELSTRRDTLLARLERIEPSSVPDDVSMRVPEPASSVSQPPQPDLAQVSEIERRAGRKRALVDHVLYFLHSDQDGLLAELNAMIVDPRRDVGDMLEILPWGDVWTARADQETLEQQNARLAGWYETLSDRFGYWQQRIARLQQDPGYALAQEMWSRGDEQWKAFLQEMVERQKEENERLAQAVALLEQRLQTVAETSDGEAAREETQAEKAQWTILVYMATNGDTDELATQGLEQILSVGSAPQTNLLVLCDRPNGATRYVVGRLGTEATEETLDGFNSGDPDALLDTMRWAVANWPAERYGLILSSHKLAPELVKQRYSEWEVR